jgi:hypothetical protein
MDSNEAQVILTKAFKKDEFLVTDSYNVGELDKLMVTAKVSAKKLGSLIEQIEGQEGVEKYKTFKLFLEIQFEFLVDSINQLKGN